MLKDPSAWARHHHIDVDQCRLEELIKQREALVAQGRAVKTQSRELSREIGLAKQEGRAIDQLLAQKKVLSATEKASQKAVKALDCRLLELLVPVPEEPRAEVCQSSAANETLDVGAVVVAQLTEADCADWDRFVDRHPASSVYHQSVFRAIVQRSFGHQSFNLIARHQGECVGVLPLVRLRSALFGDYMVSQPFFNYGGVLAVSDAVRDLLLDHAAHLARELGCSHIEYRDSAPIPDLPVRTDKVAMWLTLPEDREALWRQIGSKVRAQVKRGDQCELVAESGGVALLDDFYTVFAINMRDLGTPVYAKAFFRETLTSSLNDTRLVVVRRAGRPVSAALLIGHRDRMEVPWASTLRGANRYNANMFLYWKLLCEACDGGYRVFDFGRSTEGAATYRFKKQWGAKPVPLYWHYWLSEGGDPPRMNPDNPKYRLIIAVWRRMPVWLTRLLGPHIVKYLP